MKMSSWTVMQLMKGKIIFNPITDFIVQKLTLWFGFEMSLLGSCGWVLGIQIEVLFERVVVSFGCGNSLEEVCLWK